MVPIHIEFYLDGVKQVEFDVLPGGRTMPRSFWQIGDDVDDPGRIKVQYAWETEEVAYWCFFNSSKNYHSFEKRNSEQ